MFKTFTAILLAMIGLAGFSNASFANEDAWLALQKAAFAARELNYQGIFVYQNGKQMRSVQITHMNNAGQELTRNMILDNQTIAGKAPSKQPREVFSQGSDIVIFHPKNDKVIIAYSGHGMLSKEYDYYLSTYSVNFEKPEQNGLPYDELENLLDSIPARKKLYV